MKCNRTPLRYPGGKQKLFPFIKEILLENDITENYVEPYAGGAGVAMGLLLNGDVERIHLNDSDFGIFAFWHTVINDNERLCREIASASLTIEEWKRRKEIVKSQNADLFDLGYSVFYLNRCNRSGVLSAGVIGGLNQTGNYKMDVRFSRNDLIRRIEAIGLFKDQISIQNLDAEVYIHQYLPQLSDNTLVYLDPPYFNKAKDLYLNSYLPEDHALLARVIQNDITKHWVLSYDGVSEILDLYDERRYFTYSLQYSAEKKYKGKEVFIFGDDLEIPADSNLSYINQGLSQMIL